MTNLTLALRSFVQRYGTSDSQGGTQDVGSFDSGRWVAFSNQDLGGGVLRFRLRGNGPTNVSGSGTIS
ncbi:MAG: hypothetical protein SF123_25685, partial [Chloroflexota bacterium]|nr:hypothetical protein [Chloroflexota bacterium]